MSDLQQQNTNRMIAEAQRMHAEVERLTLLVKTQNAKMSTLQGEMVSLKEQMSKILVAQHMDTTRQELDALHTLVRSLTVKE